MEMCTPKTRYSAVDTDDVIEATIETMAEIEWIGRKRRIREYYAAAEYQGRMSDFCAKIYQFSTAVYQSIGRRNIKKAPCTGTGRYSRSSFAGEGI